MTKPQEHIKLRVKIADGEFEAEGPPEIVDRQFREFQRLLAHDHPAGGPSPESGPGQAPASPSPIERLLRHDAQTQTVSLRVLPPGDLRQADAALLVLLGHRRLRGDEEVAVTRVTEALRQSGVVVDRLDRVLGRYAKQQMVLKAGQGKGGRYRLTNVGIKHAEALASELSRLVE